MRVYSSIYITLLFCLLAIGLMAQPKDRPTLAEVEIDKVFIDATKEKLKGNYEDAAYLFAEVLKKDAKSHAAAYELSRMYDVLEKNDMALKSIEKAVELQPDNVWYQDMYGQILDTNGRYGKAAETYGILASAHPDNEYFKFQQAYFLIKDNRPADAIVVYDKLERQMGVNEELVRKKYTLYYGLGDKKAAVKEVNKIIALFPSEKRYYHILADFYKSEGKEKEMKAMYQKILKLDPNDAEASLAMAGSFKGKEEEIYLEAISPLIGKTDVGIDIKVRELYPFIMRIGKSKGEPWVDKALALGETLTQTHPQDAKAYSVFADMLYQNGDIDKALGMYDKTLELDKSVFAVWEQIMYIHADKKQDEKVIEVSEKAMDVFPNHAKVYYMNGIAHRNLGNRAEAVSVLEEALMMSGKKMELKYEIYNILGMEYYRMNKADRAGKLFNKAIAMNEDYYAAYHNYSYAIAESGKNLEKAKELAQKANQLKPDHYPCEANMARILFMKKDYKNAIEWMDKSLSNGGSENPSTVELHGDVLFKAGKKDEAIEQWKKAQALGEDSKELERKISEGAM